MIDYSVVNLWARDKVIKGYLPEDLRLEILKSASNKADPSIICSLDDTDRTGWHLQMEEGFVETGEKIGHFLHRLNMSFLLDQPNTRSLGASRVEKGAVTELYNLWVAWYNDKSFVRPHNHSGLDIFGGAMSFVAYLEAPPEGTSLTFTSEHVSEFYAIKVRQNDVLIFPSDITHYSNDTSDGRTVVSGNFLFRMSFS